jgi:hypothetical protein
MSSLNPLNFEALNDLQDRVNGNVAAAPLTPEQSAAALQDKHHTIIYPELERAYIDPEYNIAHKFTLHSFIPAKGAVPDKDGVYGLLKIRGVFTTDAEANHRADYVVANIDSYNRIFTCKMGHPIPLMSAEALRNSKHPIHRINVNTKVKDEVSENIRNKLQDEQKRISEIKARERELVEDAQRKDDVPEDRYTVLRTKRAQHAITVLKNIRLVADMIKLVHKYNAEIHEMELKDDTLEKAYMQKYISACEQSGIDQSTQDSKDMVSALKDVPADLYEYDILFKGATILADVKGESVNQTLDALS